MPEDHTDRKQWVLLEESIKACKQCGLCETRRNVVIGRGECTASILMIGEGPGENEDRQGLPFVGQAGKLLDSALKGLRFAPDSYYIANIVKCRPPQNRAPTDEEAEVCLPFLRQQLRLIKPKIIVCLGGVAVRHIIGKDFKITRIRGEWIDRKGWWIMPTFHPAALLRDEDKKIDMWQDLKKVCQKYNELKSDLKLDEDRRNSMAD